MRRFEKTFLLLLVPISFFTVVINMSSYVIGYGAIALIVTGLFFFSISFRDIKLYIVGKQYLTNSKLNSFLLLFLFSILISSIMSTDIGKTLRGLFLVLTLVVLVYFLYLRRISKENMGLFLGVIVGAVLLFQFINTIILFTDLQAPPFFQSQWWYLSSITPYWEKTLFNPNTSGMIIAFSIPALFKLAYLSKGKSKAVYILIGLLLFAGLVFSTSRAAILMVITYTLLLLIFKFKRYFSLIIKAIVIALISVITLLQFLSINFNSLVKAYLSLSGRGFLWSQGMEFIQQRPLFGFGFRTIPEIQMGAQKLNFHNIYIGMAVELGILATAILVITAIYYLYTTIKHASLLNDKKQQFIAFSCIAFIISAMVHQFFEQALFFFGTHYYATTFFLIYLAILNNIIFTTKKMGE